jgi:ribonuclease P protein component
LPSSAPSVSGTVAILRCQEDFLRLREAGRVARTPQVILVHVTNGLPLHRFAVVASRKVGNATKRNRAKRILREAQRSLLRVWMLTGVDVLLIANSSTAQSSSRELEGQIFQLYRKQGFGLVGAGAPMA